MPEAEGRHLNLVDFGSPPGTVVSMTKLPAILTIALAALTFSATATAQGPTPSFDSDCVGTEWVIRNRGLEPFLIATPAGEPIGMIELGVVYSPPDDLTSVIIADTVIIRPRCEVLTAPTPLSTRLPATGMSSVLAFLALALVATGTVARRIANIKG